jgi:shikimate kinase
MRNIVLVGFMGTGKTAVGKKLAERLHMEFVDLDAQIEERMGMSIGEIFHQFGEGYFRRLEKEVVSELFEHEGLVLATGGGVVVDNENLIRLKEMGDMVHLRANPEVIFNRTKDGHHRPLLEKENRQNHIGQFLSERMKYYTEADLEIDTSDLSIDGVVEEIIYSLSEASHG